MEPPQMPPEAEWSQSGYSYLSMAQGTSLAPLTFLHFDKYEELMWTGNELGRVVSYYGAGLARYSAFVIPGTVQAIESVEELVLTLSPSSLKGRTRQGLPVFTFQSEKMQRMACMHRLTDAPSTVYLGGDQQYIMHLDFETHRELRMVKISNRDATAIRSNGKNILTADSDGQIALRDPSSLDNIRTISAHAGPILDFDVQGNQLVTCGASFRAGSMHGDPYLKMYDLRTFRTLPPMPLGFAPIFARFMPSYTDGKCLIVSEVCQVQIADMNDGSSVPLLVETGGVPLSAFAFSPSTQALAFGDQAGSTHLYVDREEPILNESAVPTEFADMTAGPPTSFAIDDATQSLAMIPLPFVNPEFDGYYASDLPEDMCEYAFRKPHPLPEYASARTVQFVTYAPNPRAGTPLARFNLCPYDLGSKEDRPASGSGLASSEDAEQEVVVPRFYKPVVWKQSLKTGDEASSLARYNRTRRVPIEYNHGANSANPLIQFLYEMPALRNIFTLHLCEAEHCVVCQIGFLFRMLSDRPPSQPASSNNVMRALRGASFPGLAHGCAPADKTQQLLHFVLETAQQNLSPSDRAAFDALLNYELTVNRRCVRCADVRSEPRTVTVFRIRYPPGDASLTFCTVFERSLNARVPRQAECDACKTASRIEETLRVRALPQLMIIDADPTSAGYANFWRKQLTEKEKRPRYPQPPQVDAEKSERLCRWGDDCRNRPHCKYAHGSADWEAECAAYMTEETGTWAHYVPSKFFTRVSGGIAAFQLHEPVASDTSCETSAYELVSMLCLVAEDPSHPAWKYVVAECLSSGSAPDPTWLLINGIAILEVTENEALHLDYRWKLPLAFVYAKCGSDVMTVAEKRLPMPVDVFNRDSCLTGNNDLVSERRQLPIPKKGDIVGIDAEFISMSKDGSKKNVGRVSVVDSSGEQVFMDDYIVGIDGDVVHDYLTQYSGIMEHDLCPIRSKKHLTTLKAAYVKVLYLVEQGVVFVGHALHNDFSVLNIYVPQDQMRDTVQLFRLPQQRLISLQFLAWHLLETKIQENAHDSVEDARISLKLYNKWQELNAAGTLEATIKWLYDQGKAMNWRLGGSPILSLEPGRDSSPATPSKGATPVRDEVAEKPAEDAVAAPIAN